MRNAGDCHDLTRFILDAGLVADDQRPRHCGLCPVQRPVDTAADGLAQAGNGTANAGIAAPCNLESAIGAGKGADTVEIGVELAVIAARNRWPRHFGKADCAGDDIARRQWLGIADEQPCPPERKHPAVDRRDGGDDGALATGGGVEHLVHAGGIGAVGAAGKHGRAKKGAMHRQ